MTITKNYIKHSDPQILNGGDVPQSAVDFHNMQARQEAEKIASRYAKAPVYLQALANALNDLAKAAYNKHREDQQNTPEARERERIRQEILAEERQKPEWQALYGPDGTYRG